MSTTTPREALEKSAAATVPAEIGRPHGPTAQELDQYIARGHQLRAEAVGEFGRWIRASVLKAFDGPRADQQHA